MAALPPPFVHAARLARLLPKPPLLPLPRRQRDRWALAIGIGIGAALMAFVVSQIGAGPPYCSVAPLGSLPGSTPMQCLPQPLPGGPSTFVNGATGWIDTFQHGLSNSNLGSGYVTGAIGGASVIHWRHNQHWMVDMLTDTGQYPTMAAAWMRPDRTFHKVDGRVVIEFEVAGPIAGTSGTDTISDTWPEVTLSTAPAPTTSNPWGSPWRRDGTYLYEAFPWSWTFGCRMQHSRHPICAIYRPGAPGTQPGVGVPDRLWELNQNGGDVRFQEGGDPSTPGLDDKWAVCAKAEDPDAICRNLFRLELTNTELWLYVKKPGAPAYSLYYHAGLIDDSLGNILDNPGGFYVFFGDFVYQVVDDTVVRFHWDRLAVNPESVPGGVVPSPTATVSPSPSRTPTPGPTVTPSSTPTVGPSPTAAPPTVTAVPGVPSPTTLTFDDLPGTNVPLNGTYSGIAWGTNKWFLSSPWGQFTTKSISFSGAALKSATFTLPAGRRLVSLVAYTQGAGNATLTLACAGQPTKTQVIVANAAPVTVATGWTTPCSVITVTSSNGWDQNWDDLVLAGS